MAAPISTLSGSAGETRGVGREIGRRLKPSDYICLYGELGAGKTTLVQGIAEGLGVEEEYITSPSFALVNEYHGRLVLYHIDLYRLSEPDELEGIGFTEFPGEGVVALEWPERAGLLLPDERLDVRLDYAGDDRRDITLSAAGKRYEDLLEDLCRSSPWSRR